MRKINGFINLDEILALSKPNENEDFKELSKRLLENKTAEVIKCKWPTQLNFCFNIDGKKYFFGYDSIADPYIELIIEEIASELNIPYVNHTLAVIGNYKGVISENYKVENAQYIRMYDILKEFYDQEDPNPKYEYPELRELNEYFERKDKGIINNSLEKIWFALENRYKDRVDMQEVVKNIMKKIIDVFILDIITGQLDRNATNLEIVEYEDGKVDLQPIFDNGRAMLNDPILTNVCLTVDHDYWRNLSDVIERFERFSSSEFSDLFIDYLWVIENENIKSILDKVEEKIGCKLDDELRDMYLLKFKIYYEFLQDELGYIKRRS